MTEQAPALAFVECHVVAGERVIARGSATFKLG
jgi:hypothetical protein